jgi:hypothetical protein
MSLQRSICLAAIAASSLLAQCASADVVIIVAARSSLAPSVEQVCQVFLGKTNTPMAISFTDKSATRDEFYTKACKKTPAQVRAMWGKLLFTGTGTPPDTVETSADMKRAIAGNSERVGYIDKRDVDASVKILADLN